MVLSQSSLFHAYTVTLLSVCVCVCVCVCKQFVCILGKSSVGGKKRQLVGQQILTKLDWMGKIFSLRASP